MGCCCIGVLTRDHRHPTKVLQNLDPNQLCAQLLNSYDRHSNTTQDSDLFKFAIPEIQITDPYTSKSGPQANANGPETETNSHFESPRQHTNSLSLHSSSDLLAITKISTIHQTPSKKIFKAQQSTSKKFCTVKSYLLVPPVK
jgi:hypothetical protein